MAETNPWFPYAYPAGNYVSSFNRRTLSSELLLETVQRSNPEVVRRIVGLQLFIFETYGLRMGWGTGWRVQTANPDGSALPGHAKPGNSWHEGIPIASKANAFAVDTVGCDGNGVPRHGDVWTLQERHCEGFGLVSFLYLEDRPHLQATDIPRSRSFRNTLASLPVWPLPKWALPARYDLDCIDRNDPLAAPPPDEEDDDMPKPMLITDGTSVYATDGTSISGVGGPTILAKAIELGLFANSEPILVPREEIDATLRTE